MGDTPWFITEGFARGASSKVHIHNAQNRFVGSTIFPEHAQQIIDAVNKKEELERDLAALRRRIIQSVYQPSPMCRDCADHDGTCPHDSLPCDSVERAFVKIESQARDLAAANKGLGEAIGNKVKAEDAERTTRLENERLINELAAAREEIETLKCHAQHVRQAIQIMRLDIC